MHICRALAFVPVILWLWSTGPSAQFGDIAGLALAQILPPSVEPGQIVKRFKMPVEPLSKFPPDPVLCFDRCDDQLSIGPEDDLLFEITEPESQTPAVTVEE